MFSTYHMTNPVVFYNKEDQWQIPAIDIDGNPQLMQPYYTIMRLPGEEHAEFIQMLPFTPARKDNLAAWMVAHSDPEHYGQLEVFEFPRQKIVYGPRQIIARINQDQVISPQITLWNQQGSQVIQGTLLVIPIGEVAAVRAAAVPAGVRRQNSRVEPRHRRISESDRDGAYARRRAGAHLRRRVEWRPRARGDLPPTSSTSAAPAPGGQAAAGTAPAATNAVLVEQARQHYERAMQAQRDGNWALYGDEIKLLGETLRGDV